MRYEFNDTDIETSISVLRKFLTENPEIPWDALSYVTGHINYGGRVTDDWDRRCLISMLTRFYLPEIIDDDDYRYSKSGTYYVPPPTDRKGYIDYMESLPKVDDPELFGMHSNADITFQKKESFYMMFTMLSLQPRATGGGEGKSSDEIVTDLALDIQPRTPAILDEDDAQEDVFTIMPNGLISPISTVLAQEMIKFNRLLRMMNTSLRDIQKAIKGMIVMSVDLDKMYTAFLNNAVPDLWCDRPLGWGFASLKPLGSWVKDLIGRVDFLHKWLTEGEPPAFPLQLFFFPQGFMTGLVQAHARKHMVAVDTLAFSFRVLDMEPEEITEGPEDGVYAYGMFMEGAKWDAKRRVIGDPVRGELYSAMKPVQFTPAVNYKKRPEDYACPVYKTTLRCGALSTTGISTNFVVAVFLPTDRKPESWIANGTAFVLNLDD